MISQEKQGMMIEEEPIQIYDSHPASSYPKIFLITEMITADDFESLWQDFDYYKKQEDEKICLAIEVSEQTCWEILLEKVFKSDPQMIEKVDYVDFRGKVTFDNLVGLYKQYKAFQNKPLWPILYISLVLKPEELSQDLKRKLQDLTGNRMEAFSERDWVEGRGKSSQVRVWSDTWKDEEKKGKNDIKTNWSDVLQEIDYSWDWDPRELKRGEKDVVLEGFIERLYSKDI